MLAFGFVLSSDHHFKVAMHNSLLVEVWLHGELLDYGGPIEAINDHFVTIQGAKYPRSTCKFKIR